MCVCVCVCVYSQGYSALCVCKKNKCAVGNQEALHTFKPNHCQS